MVDSDKRTSKHQSGPLNVSILSSADPRQIPSVYERQPPQAYTSDKIAGNGTFGVVYLASIAETGEKVAIKKVFQDPRYKNRELELMQQLTHPNIVALHHSFFTEGAKPNELFLNLVMEFVPDTLHKVVRGFLRKNSPVPLVLAKLYAYQILRSIGYCHLMGICHRDIKPQNLLVDPVTHRLVLCDFGSAKRLVRGEPNIAYICSRYYRAPELILGATAYATAIDIWSAGCVIAEIFLGKPLFPGESASDQIVEIIKVLGTPNREQLFDMNSKYSGPKLPEIRGTPWARVFKGKVPAEALSFLESLLVYSPGRRPNAYQALHHPFFDELRREGCRLPSGGHLPELFNWNDIERKFIESYVNV
jgi:glycogen synthase kinase 3 beta